jgi:hypothetical protein
LCFSQTLFGRNCAPVKSTFWARRDPLHISVGHADEAWAEEIRKKAQAKDGDPERRAEIAAAKRGKPRPTPVGWVPFGTAWTAEADELVRTLPPAEAAELTGHPLGSVYQRRSELGVTMRWKSVSRREC